MKAWLASRLFGAKRQLRFNSGSEFLEHLNSLEAVYLFSENPGFRLTVCLTRAGMGCVKEEAWSQISRAVSLNCDLFSRQQLLDLWEELYKKPVAPGLRREVMIPFLAYRMQELAYGGLKTTTRNELRRLARALKEKSLERASQPRPTA